MGSFGRRWRAGVGNHLAWAAHVFAFAPEPETDATWRCKCGVRNPIHRKRCLGCGR